MTFSSFLLLAAGGSIGAVLRWVLSVALIRIAPNVLFPYPTLIVNLLGCFLLGVYMGAEPPGAERAAVRLFCVTGFLGSFTTFSTFSGEVLSLIEREHWPLVLAYSFSSLVCGVLGVFLGVKGIRLVLSLGSVAP